MMIPTRHVQDVNSISVNMTFTDTYNVNGVASRTYTGYCDRISYSFVSGTRASVSRGTSSEGYPQLTFRWTGGTSGQSVSAVYRMTQETDIDYYRVDGVYFNGVEILYIYLNNWRYPPLLVRKFFNLLKNIIISIFGGTVIC